MGILHAQQIQGFSLGFGGGAGGIHAGSHVAEGEGGVALHQGGNDLAIGQGHEIGVEQPILIPLGILLDIGLVIFLEGAEFHFAVINIPAVAHAEGAGSGIPEDIAGGNINGGFHALGLGIAGQLIHIGDGQDFFHAGGGHHIGIGDIAGSGFIGADIDAGEEIEHAVVGQYLPADIGVFLQIGIQIGHDFGGEIGGQIDDDSIADGLFGAAVVRSPGIFDAVGEYAAGDHHIEGFAGGADGGMIKGDIHVEDFLHFLPGQVFIQVGNGLGHIGVHIRPIGDLFGFRSFGHRRRKQCQRQNQREDEGDIAFRHGGVLLSFLFNFPIAVCN